MSYILDALRRSDQDRKKGDVPGLQSQPDALVRESSVPLKSGRKNVLLWLLLILVALQLVWILPKPINTDNGEPAIAKTDATLDSVPPADVAPRAPAEAAQQEQLSNNDLHLDDLKDVQMDISTVDEAEATVPQTPIPEAPEEQSSDLPATATRQGQVEAESPDDAAQSAPQLSESIPPADSAGSDADPYEGIPHQRQLPYDLQKALPELNISVHIYSATPSSRLVRINSKIYQEGDSINNELKLEEITRDGLIMSIRNERFWLQAS
jgi:general secretion pathway protein B